MVVGLLRRALFGSGVVGGTGYVIKERNDYTTRRSVALEFLDDRPSQINDFDELEDDQLSQDVDELLRNFAENKRNAISTVHKDHSEELKNKNLQSDRINSESGAKQHSSSDNK
jgi:glutamate synthase domain-containing protein 3